MTLTSGTPPRTHPAAPADVIGPTGGRPDPLTATSNTPDAAITRPASARVYNHLIGGFHNFAADRHAADQLTTALPTLPALARANQAYLARTVGRLLRHDITQFLNLGCGLLTTGSLHHILTGTPHPTRAVHIDTDPVVIAHARDTLHHQRDNRHRATVIHADLRRPDHILNHPATGLLDLDRPVAIIATAVLHHLPHHPAPLLATYRDATVTGSHLVLTHPTSGPHPAHAAHLTATATAVGLPITLRTRATISALFSGYRLTPPGVHTLPSPRVTPSPQPPPESQKTGSTAPVMLLAGTGRKTTPR